MSSTAMFLTMTLSLLYGLRFFHGWERLDIPWMRAWHGTGNALGACLCGLAAWLIQRKREPQLEKPGLPNNPGFCGVVRDSS